MLPPIPYRVIVVSRLTAMITQEWLWWLTAIKDVVDTLVDAVLNLDTRTYVPATAYADTGTLASGHTVSRVQTKDGTDYQVTEASGADPLRVRFVFVDVLGFDTLLIFGRYEGSASHEVRIEVYNRATTTWETVGTMPTETANRWYSVPLWYSEDYITNPGTDNYFEVRVRHVSSGTPTHNLYLDYVGLRWR